MDQNAGTITGAIKLSSTGDTLNVNGGSISGNITGPGSGGVISFTLGAGNIFTYNSNFTSFTAVDINSGTVVLNGTDSATNMSVFSGGTLAGTGTLDPTLQIFSGGTLAPGPVGGIGTMTINGNLQFFAGSTYQVTISPTQASMAQVNGTATLGGATVLAAPLVGTYAPHTYTILADTGNDMGVGSNTFSASVTTTRGALLDPVLTYVMGGDDVDLTIQGYVVTLNVPANAPANVQNVANAIDPYVLNGGTPPPGFQNLYNYTPQQIENALTQLEGQPATGAQTSAFQLMTDFMNLLSDPSGGGGGSPTGGGAPGFAPEQEANLPSDNAQAYASILTKAPPQQQSFDQRWSAWGSAFGGAGKLDGDPIVGSNNVTASDYGFAGGMDYRPTPDSVYGFALAGGGTNWSVAGNLGTGRSDSVQIGVHDTTHWGPLYLSGALAFANHWFTTNRIAVGDQLQAKFDGQSYAARGEAGYRYAVPVTGQIIGVTPYAALQVQEFHTPGFSETDLTGGGMGLNFASQNATDTRSELGMRFDNVQVVNNMPLVLRARVAWAHDWVSNPALGAVFQALPGSSFTVNGASPPQNSALGSASAELHLTANWSAIAKFDGEFASTAQTYAGTGTLKYSW
ncbi:MAG: autotransporter domain-containing protein [Xanthobacteraceae bacterium]